MAPSSPGFLIDERVYFFTELFVIGLVMGTTYQVPTRVGQYWNDSVHQKQQQRSLHYYIFPF
jgi:hypothetical protein